MAVWCLNNGRTAAEYRSLTAVEREAFDTVTREARE